MSAERYPLSWPMGWKRTSPRARQRANFKTHRGETRRNSDGTTHRVIDTKPVSTFEAVRRLRLEVERLGVRESDLVISTNVPTKYNGLPYSNAREPEDPGVAVYFKLKGHDRVLACDAWITVAGNLAAVAQHIDALRRIDRYGVGTMDQAFAGYAALPAKGSTWRTTLGFTLDQNVTVDMLKAARRERAKDSHPDVEGGSHDAMASLNAAVNEGLAELGAQ